MFKLKKGKTIFKLGKTQWDWQEICLLLVLVTINAYFTYTFRISSVYGMILIVLILGGIWKSKGKIPTK